MPTVNSPLPPPKRRDTVRASTEYTKIQVRTHLLLSISLSSLIIFITVIIIICRKNKTHQSELPFLPSIAPFIKCSVTACFPSPIETPCTVLQSTSVKNHSQRVPGIRKVYCPLLLHLPLQRLTSHPSLKDLPHSWQVFY